MSLLHTPYFPSKVFSRNEIDFFDEVEKGIEQNGTVGKTSITGDFNSRTSNLSDTIDESDPLSQTPFSDDSNVTFLHVLMLTLLLVVTGVVCFHYVGHSQKM